MKKRIAFICGIFLLSACMLKIYPSAPTHTPYATFLIPTRYPTLPVETQNEFYRLLQTNGNCELPCFLGIRPGETSVDQALSFLETYEYYRHLSFEQIKFSGEYWYYGNFSIEQEHKSISFVLRLQMMKNTVSGLIVNFDPVIDSGIKADRNNKFLERYGLLELLQQHGVPDEIYIYPTRSRSQASVYSVEIIYNTKKIYARYSGVAKLDENDKYKLCPIIGDGDIDIISLALGDPSNRDLNMIELIWGSFNDHFDLEYYVSEYPQLDPEAVYGLFVTKGERCFYEDEYRFEK